MSSWFMSAKAIRGIDQARRIRLAKHKAKRIILVDFYWFELT